MIALAVLSDKEDLMHDVIMSIDSRTTFSMATAWKLSTRACTAPHKCQAHATVHVVKLVLLRVNIHVDRTESQLILDDSLFQLEDTCGRFLSDKLAVSLKCPRC